MCQLQILTGAKLIEHAVMFATEAHAGQVDKQNLPYILHPLRVMEKVRQVAGYDPELMAAAVLHDVTEDCNVTEKQLAAYGFPERTVKVVHSVSKLIDQKENYITFVRRANQTLDSRVVKLADVQDNLWRVPVKLDSQWWKKQAIKYTIAEAILKGDHIWLDTNKDLIAGFEAA